MNQNNNIYQKLATIQGEISNLTKSKENKFQNYKYFDEYATLTKIKPLLAKQNLSLTFSDEVEHFSVEEKEKGGGKKDWFAEFRVLNFYQQKCYTFFCYTFGLNI
jgi:hypothetical protein